MGFKDARSKVLGALRTGNFLHESRGDIDAKNKLMTGEVTSEDVAAVIRRSNGRDHSMSPLHGNPGITVHVIARESWYIKFYFVDPNALFISVHKSGRRP